MGQQGPPGETEEAETAAGAVNSEWLGCRSTGPPHLHLRRQYDCDIETDLRHRKIALGMDVRHGRTEAGVLEEVTLLALVYNLVRVVTTEAGRRPGASVERISFVDALRRLSCSPPGTPLPQLVVNPDRPNRVEPRCQKRRGKNYPYLIHTRAVRRQLLLAQVPTP